VQLLSQKTVSGWLSPIGLLLQHGISLPVHLHFLSLCQYISINVKASYHRTCTWRAPACMNQFQTPRHMVDRISALEVWSRQGTI